MKRNRALLKDWRPGDDKAGSGAGAKIGDVLPPVPPSVGVTHKPHRDGCWMQGACGEGLDSMLERIENGADPRRIIDALRDKASHRHLFSADLGHEGDE